MTGPTRLSIIVPCYNERATIAEILRRVRAAAPDLVKQIVVVDDASTDGTRELLEGPLAASIDALVLHPRNRGKGAAIRSGLARADGGIVIIQDADLEYDPNDYPKLIGPILRRAADVVYGSRFAGGDERRVVYFWHMLANRLLTLLSNALTNLNLTDMETGFKAFRTDVLRAAALVEDRFGFEPEVTAKLARRGAIFYEVGISYAGRTYAQGKKIGWRDAFRALYAIVRYRFFE